MRPRKMPFIFSNALVSTRRGISLTEIVVVTSIITLLLSITIPAVQSARESARRVQCSNQLRQIALAAQNYESGFGVYPSQKLFTQIRPYVEIAANLRDVPMFACPSDGQATGDVSANRLSYSVNAGLGTHTPEHYGFSRQEYGFVPRNTRLDTTASDITDGLSNTVMVGERLARPHYAPNIISWDDHPNDWNRTFFVFRSRVTTPEQFREQCTLYAERPINKWVNTTYHHHLMTPNTKSCVLVENDGLPGGSNLGIGLMCASLHHGGVYVSYCDGSVKFISDSIDIAIWRAQGTRAGGESVSF